MCRTPDVYSAYKLKKGAWVPAKLRITSFAVEKVDSQGEQTSGGSRLCSPCQALIVAKCTFGPEAGTGAYAYTLMEAVLRAMGLYEMGCGCCRERAVATRVPAHGITRSNLPHQRGQ